ncbi:MAG: insulinase family protein [Spirochaetes bacterium]|nr:insulinase family protein [Spirochaetota bacterium]
MKKIKIFVLFFFILFSLYSCGTSAQFSLYSKESVISSGNINNFAKTNLPTFTVKTLSNGIPVIIKNNPYNRIQHIKVIINGGVLLSNVKNAGIENVMLSLLTKGSKNYSYDDIKKILSDTSSSISTSTGFDYSEYSLNTLDYYFDKVFDIYVDCFTNPTFPEYEFDTTKDEFLRNLDKKANDPYSKMVDNLNKALFKGHPYEASWDGTEESIKNLKYKDVVDYYKRTISSNRLFIVAVGNFNNDKLFNKLNDTFGKIPNKNIGIPSVSNFLGKVKSDVIYEVNAIGGGVAYVRGDFAIPEASHPDFMPLRLALAILDDMLFEIVRTQNSACYSAWTQVRIFKANYGSIVVYKTTVPDKVKYYIDEAIAYLLMGKVIAPKASVSAEGKGGMGQEVDLSKMSISLVSINEVLETYKNIFINSFFESQQTNAAIASQIAQSILLNGDYRNYLLFMDQVRAITADQIIAVAKKYLYDNKILWSVLGSEDVMKNFKPDIYKIFTKEDLLKK